MPRRTFCSGDQRPTEPKVYHYNLFLADLVGQSVYLDQSPLLRIPYLGGEGFVLPKENDPRATEVRAGNKVQCMQIVMVAPILPLIPYTNGIHVIYSTKQIAVR